VLHNWWGNGVIVDYRAGNWAEGLTTFMADYTFAEQKDPSEARAMRLRWLRDIAALPAARDQPMRSFVSRRHGAAQVIGYNKAAMMFYMLREEIGRDAFDEAIQLLWRNWRHRIAGWDQLIEAFEQASGRDLGRVFGQWLDRTGVPAVRLEGGRVTPRDGGFRVSFALEQAAPPYELSVPVVIETASGASRHRLRLDAVRAAYTLDSPEPPLALTVDSEFQVLRRLTLGEMPPILREVMLAPEAAVVVAATDAAAREAARALAGALLEGKQRFVEAGQAGSTELPLLVVGTTPEVFSALAAAGLAAVPAELSGRGTARVWAARDAGGRPAAVVAAADATALAQLARPLPHYGSRSYLVFEGSRAVDKGVWPAGPSPLRLEFR
jgi:aminopeptidase N